MESEDKSGMAMHSVHFLHPKRWLFGADGDLFGILL